MVALSIARLATLSPKPRGVGMLASPAVRKVGLYTQRLKDAGFTALFSDAAGEAKVLDIIRAVKANAMTPQHRAGYSAIARTLREQGADALLIACTELSILGAPEGAALPYIDTLDVLVSATIEESCT